MASGFVNKAGIPLRQHVYRVTYLLGITVRLTLKFIRSPYRVMKNKFLLRKTSTRELQSTFHRHMTITSSLSRMQNRLQSIEHTLLTSDRIVDSKAIQDSKEYVFGLAGKTAEEDSEALAEAMTNSNPGVRSFALGTVGEHAGEEVTLLILDALNDPEPSVRCAAASATARAEISPAVFSLILLLADSVPQVVQEAKVAIEKITGRKVDFSPRNGASTRQKKIEELKIWWKEERFARLSAEVKAAMKS